jgi:cobalamin biosynthesis protein CobD/CbiB
MSESRPLKEQALHPVLRVSRLSKLRKRKQAWTRCSGETVTVSRGTMLVVLVTLVMLVVLVTLVTLVGNGGDGK